MNIAINLGTILKEFHNYELNYGEKFFNDNYGMKIINEEKTTIREIFECTEQQEYEFWDKNLVKCMLKSTLIENAIKTFDELNKENKVTIYLSNMNINENSKNGKLIKFVVSEWLKTNNIKYNNIVFNVNDIKKFVEDNKINILVNDKSENIKLDDSVKIVFHDNNKLINEEINKEIIAKRAYDEIKPLSGMPSIDKPWLKFYSYSERSLIIPHSTIYEYMKHNNQENLNKIAINYYGRKFTYEELFNNINVYANALNSNGVKKGDVVTLCLANVPEAIFMFYAINKIGATANMIHPLKSSNEIKTFLNEVQSKTLVLMDNSYKEINAIIDETSVNRALVVSAGDSMPLPLRLAYNKTSNINVDYENNKKYMKLKDYLKNDEEKVIESCYNKDSVAVMIHTGGSTGEPKAVQITDDNFNLMVHQQRATAKDFAAGDSMLTIMPVFHGFGLCSSVHMPLSYGITVILVPKFSSNTFHKLIKKYKPNHVFGVPKLWKSLINNPEIQKMNLSFLKYVVSGGENMKNGLEEEINKFLYDHGCKYKIKKGYGLSEAVAGTTLSDDYSNELGSVGIPLVCNSFKIVKPGTQQELNYNEEGELCISGPTVMKGYYNKEEENKDTLQIHSDGKLWLHTGDMGYMTEDGMLYYTDRLTRMYVSGGFNIYPPRIEKVIEQLEEVDSCAVVPMNHPYKDVKVPKAYIILKDGYQLDENLILKVSKICKENLDLHHQPYKYEKTNNFPITNLGGEIGKIDYNALEAMANERIKTKVK